MARRSPLITVMAAAADKAARALLRDFNEVEHLQVSRKGPNDFVSAADVRAERTLKEELARAKPKFGFLLEGSGASGSSEEGRWIIDPLDGTLNFLHALPHFCISIAAEQHGELVAGVVFDPLRDETFWAEKGQGAYVNRRRLRAASRDKLAESLIGHGRAATQDDQAIERFLNQIRRVLTHTCEVRRMGVAALDLAYVAAGRLDGFWEERLRPWDIAAGAVLVREAGGYVTGIDGRDLDLERGDILAANPHIHGALHKVLAGH